MTFASDSYVALANSTTILLSYTFYNENSGALIMNKMLVAAHTKSFSALLTPEGDSLSINNASKSTVCQQHKNNLLLFNHGACQVTTVIGNYILYIQKINTSHQVN